MGGFAYGLGDLIRRAPLAAPQTGPRNSMTLEGLYGLADDFQAGLSGDPAVAGQRAALQNMGNPATPPAPTLAEPLPASPSGFNAEEGAAALSRGMARRAAMQPQDLSGLQAGEFQGRPQWSNNGTLGQQLGDMQARQLLEAKYALEDQATAAEDARRPDPMALAIEGQKQNRAYEDLLPAGSGSSIRAEFGQGWGPLTGTEVGSSAVGEMEFGAPSVGELRGLGLQRQRALMDPKIASNVQQDSLRQQAMGELAQLSAKLKAAGYSESDIRLSVEAAAKDLFLMLGLREGDFGAVGSYLKPPANALPGLQ